MYFCANASANASACCNAVSASSTACSAATRSACAAPAACAAACAVSAASSAFCASFTSCAELSEETRVVRPSTKDFISNVLFSRPEYGNLK